MPSDDFVALTSRFTSGWPWPDDSWGLSPMYGDDGWCHACGIPAREQSGSLILRAAKFPTSHFWMPNWQFDALCVRLEAAAAIIDKFNLRTMPVQQPKLADTGVVQLLPVVTAAAWYDVDRLRSLATARHGNTGSRCSSCGTWRWLPLSNAELPAPHAAATETSEAFIASPEWFGSGMSAHRQLLFRRPLGEALVALNRRVWSLVESGG